MQSEPNLGRPPAVPPSRNALLSSSTADSSSSVFDVRTTDGGLRPVLIITRGGISTISTEVMRFTSYLRSRGDSLGRTRAACTTLGLLVDFIQKVLPDQPLRPEALAPLVALFLRARRTGQHVLDDGTVQLLGWEPVQRETVQRDRYFIAEYSEFCVLHLSHFALAGEQSADVSGSPSYLAALRRLARIRAHTRDSDLLHHIAHKRSPGTAFGIGIPESIVRRRPSRFKRTLSYDAVRRVIDRTRSPMQKMLLIEAFFGGPRISEMLHQWRCDVLPGSYRHALFPDDRASSLPVVLLAHPSQSRYVGALSDYRVDRLQHLRREYNLLPRTFAEGLPQKLGWKSLQFDNSDIHVAQVFWASAEYAYLFEELHRYVRKNLYQLLPPEVTRSHPYMYVNDCLSHGNFGAALKMSNARNIFIRAFERVDETAAFRNGAHSARHFYKAMLEELGMSETDIQKCMHHVSIQSQANYNREASRTGNRLREALALDLSK